MITIISSCLLIIFYRIAELQQHGKLTEEEGGFWGSESWIRKYKFHYKHGFSPAPDNWYYRFIDSPYKERWFTSTWLTVQFTDGYHMLQWCWLRCLNVIIADNMPGNFWLWFFGSWVGVSGLMYLTEKALTKR